MLYRKADGLDYLHFNFFTMEITRNLSEFQENETFYDEDVRVTSTPNDLSNGTSRDKKIIIIQSTAASVGIVANLTVIVVFLNHKKLRRKIPNIFIINQVRTIPFHIYCFR